MVASGGIIPTVIEKYNASMWGGIGGKGCDDGVFRARAGTPDL